MTTVFFAVAPPEPLLDSSPETKIQAYQSEVDEEDANIWLSVGASVAMAGALFAWAGHAWWKDGELGRFHLRETGAFGKETYAGGADKMGHAYAVYVMGHVGAEVYQAAGMQADTAAWVSFGATLLVANWVEFVDGFTDFGFEYGDVLANTAGAVMALLTRLYPSLDDTLGFRLGYVPSTDFLENDKSLLKFINDYSGMSFYLDLRLRGLLPYLGRDPGLARFLVTGVVYGTDQYSPVRRHALRRRWVGAHIGLDVGELLRWQSDNDEGVGYIAKFFDYYAVPLMTVAVLRDLNNQSWMINFGVANRMELGL